MRYHRSGQHECYGFAPRLQSPAVTRMVPSPPGPPQTAARSGRRRVMGPRPSDSAPPAARQSSTISHDQYGRRRGNQLAPPAQPVRKRQPRTDRPRWRHNRCDRGVQKREPATQRGLTDWHTQTAPALEKPQSDLPVSQFRRGEVMCRDYVLSNGRLWPRR